MNFTVLNGAALNASIEDGVGGLDLVTTGSHVMANGLAVAGAVALELGDMRIGASITFASLDLASTGTHTLVVNMDIEFAGLELVTHGTHVFQMSIAPAGLVALELGDFRLQNGEDVEIRFPGIELVRNGFHSLLSGAILPGDAVLQVPSTRPLELGDFAIAAGPVAIEPVGKVAREMGGLSTRGGLLPAGITALELGGLGTVQVTIMPAGLHALELGPIATTTSITVGGLDLVRHGQPTIEADGFALAVAGAVALELGGLGSAPTIGLRVRQHFALEMGGLSVDRGNAC